MTSEPIVVAAPKPGPKAGRNLRAAITIGVLLGAAVAASLFIAKVAFVVSRSR